MSDVDPQEGADNPVEDERPEWLPSNFKSPEDLARSYQEAQRKITELSTENKGVSALASEVSELREMLAAQNAPDPAEVEAQWQNAYDTDPWGTARQYLDNLAASQLRQAQAPAADTSAVVARMAVQDVAAKYGDFDQYKDQVREIITTYSLFQNVNYNDLDVAAHAIENAYMIAKASDPNAGVAVQQQQLADTRQMKLNAQSATGAAGRPDSPDANANRWQEIVSAPSGKLEF